MPQVRGVSVAVLARHVDLDEPHARQRGLRISQLLLTAQRRQPQVRELRAELELADSSTSRT